MNTNDFLGSFAQENVSFTTQIVRNSSVGDNFWTTMIFVEPSRFVDSTAAVWENIPGSSTIKALVVEADNYAEYTNGLLAAWLYDLFCNGSVHSCILVSCPVGGEEETDFSTFIANMEAAYDLLKAYAYHKTVCAGGDNTVAPAIAVALATKCAADKGLLSGAPLLPFTSSTPETVSSDALYAALQTAGKDAFMSYHKDTTHNAALYSLGLALAVEDNGSGTPIGNSMDMTSSTNITASATSPSDTTSINPASNVKSALKLANIQYFKTVGDNSGSVAALGDKTINGDVYSAYWILSYITYMSKVGIAQLITTRNFLKNNDNYIRILGVLSSYINVFGTSGSGRLNNIILSAPAFEALPTASGDRIVIPNAWSASYVDHVREVSITGSLYIGGDN